ncbi:MAG: 2-oxoglutarate and iron-dependent oxygenase domain-containing protein [Myxococcota bacterium]|nr:2-oxoglutarate and iron-dependent oxygenase domain-containing protein [Myxococcota bacterium]
MKQSIPTLDLDAFRLGDANQQARAVEQAGRAFEEYGFLAVSNHGISMAAIHNAYAVMRAFFDLSENCKLKYERREIGRQRGYTPFGKERAKNQPLSDLKEFWHSGPEFPADHALRMRLPHNIWPKEVPGFRQAVMAVWHELSDCADVLLTMLARYLGARESFFVDMVQGGNSVLRMIRYPETRPPENETDAVWAAAHEDINLITLLVEATSAGLELLNRNGDWMAIHPIPGQLIADTGDMMQRLTNGQIPATTHRVLAPKTAVGPRYSMPFFVHPHPDSELSALPQCVTERRPAQYTSQTAEAYLADRLRENGVLTIDHEVDWLGGHTIDLDPPDEG